MTIQGMHTPRIRVTIWAEEFSSGDEQWERELTGQYELARDSIYPDGIHVALAEGLGPLLKDAVIRTASFNQEQHGLSEDVLTETDVLLWWSHSKSDQLDDEVAARVVRRVLGGMGFLALHSGMDAKPFKQLMGTSCEFHRWRQRGDWEAVWTVHPGHPIARGLPPVFVIPEEEAFGEYFDIPQPDELVFLSSFEGGEAFRSGCCFYRGTGRIFFFRPGHEAYATYRQPEVLQVIANAIDWAYVATPGLDNFYSEGWPDRGGEVGWFRQVRGTDTDRL